MPLGHMNKAQSNKNQPKSFILNTGLINNFHNNKLNRSFCCFMLVSLYVFLTIHLFFLILFMFLFSIHHLFWNFFSRFFFFGYTFYSPNFVIFILFFSLAVYFPFSSSHRNSVDIMWKFYKCQRSFLWKR